MITLQFSTSLEWQSWIIRKFSHSRFSHVDVVMPDGNLHGASNSPNAPYIRGNPNGVAIRPPDYQLFGTRRWAKIRTRLEDEKRFYDFLEAQLGKPFDDTAMKAIIRDPDEHRDWADPSAWFCSEELVCGFDAAGQFPWDLVVPKNRVSPADLVLLLNPFLEDVEAFNKPIPGLKLGPHET
jgi:hypothetical protein